MRSGRLFIKMIYRISTQNVGHYSVVTLQQWLYSVVTYVTKMAQYRFGHFTGAAKLVLKRCVRDLLVH